MVEKNATCGCQGKADSILEFRPKLLNCDEKNSHRPNGNLCGSRTGRYFLTETEILRLRRKELETGSMEDWGAEQMLGEGCCPEVQA